MDKNATFYIRTRKFSNMSKCNSANGYIPSFTIVQEGDYIDKKVSYPFVANYLYCKKELGLAFGV